MKAQEFTLESPHGTKRLTDYNGRWVVLYFYPKDDTSGCTIEARDFTALAKEFQKANAIVLGVSKDSCESHSTFRRKYDLNVLLLSDPDALVQKLYGAWGEKMVMGLKMFGTIRSTFLIDPSGEIAKEWRMVKPDGHAKEVLDTLKTLKG